jgi:thiol-disulfide isomerase/thioredoxin
VDVPVWVGLVAVGVVLVAATALGLLLTRRNGRFRPTSSNRLLDPVRIDPMLAGLGVQPGTAVTLLQFSTAFCGPCRATRVLCADVAARIPGVRHVDVDAESHLEAVRTLDVWRTPTVLIVDAAGVIRRRATGAPSRSQLLAAVADVLPAGTVAPESTH